MKAYQVVLFLFGVFALLGIGWAAFPADGIPVAGGTLRFASLEKTLRDASETHVDVDSVLQAVDRRFAMQRDTLAYYRDFLYGNPDRIYLPDDDYRFFDPLFRSMEQARRRGTTVRVAHYGDSQIELDRISSDLREALQDRFGGMGTGMFPALSNVPSASISKSASGALVQYTMYGDSTTVRAGHNRYGVMAQVVTMTGGGTLSLRAVKSRTARERTKSFSSVSILVGRTSSGFDASVVSDTLRPVPSVQVSQGGVRLMTWKFSRPVQKATIRLAGHAEIYGVSTDGDAGVAVDNIPLRGCSGTIFTRISRDLMRESFALDNTRLIILQFGGYFMPMASSSKAISAYMDKVADQIRYFHEVAPQAKILFIGPSDMGKSVNGRVVTWPRLPEVVDSLKATVLRNDAAYWDLYRMMGGENSMAQWVRHSPAYAGPDYIHFTPAGAQVVGESLSRSLLTYADFYELRKRLSPEVVRAAMKP